MPVREHGVMSRYRRLVMWVSAATAAAAISATLTAGPSTASAQPSTAISKPVAARLDSYALAVALRNGDPRPTSAQAVEATAKMALSAVTPANHVPQASNQPVYLIVMTGHFTINGAGPSATRTITGKYLSVILDLRTFRAFGLGLSNRAPAIPLHRLGQVATLRNR